MRMVMGNKFICSEGSIENRQESGTWKANEEAQETEEATQSAKLVQQGMRG